MSAHDLITKYSIPAIFGSIIAAVIIKHFGISVLLLLIVFFLLLYYTILLASDLFNPLSPKKKLDKMLAKKTVLDNNIWMDKSYDLLFDNIKYLCKRGSYKVVLFKIQIEEIANIKNRAPNEDSDEYKAAALAIKRIEDFQKMKIVTIDQSNYPAPKKVTHNLNDDEIEAAKIEELEMKLFMLKKPKLPGDAKEGMRKSNLANYLSKVLTDKEEYTLISANQEVRIRLRAFLFEHSDKKLDIVEPKKVVEYAQYVDRRRLKFIEKIQKDKKYKNTKKALEISKDVAANATKFAQKVRNKK